MQLQALGERKSLPGELLDLSVSGMRVRMAGCPSDLRRAGQLMAHSRLPGVNLPLALASCVVYSKPEADGMTFGLRFLPLADTVADDNRAKLIWRFLLDAQRRLRTDRSGASTDLRPHLRIFRPPQED